MDAATLAGRARAAAYDLAEAALEHEDPRAELGALLQHLAQWSAVADDSTPRTVLEQAFCRAPADPEWRVWWTEAGAPARLTLRELSGLSIPVAKEWP